MKKTLLLIILALMLIAGVVVMYVLFWPSDIYIENGFALINSKNQIIKYGMDRDEIEKIIGKNFQLIHF